MKILMFENYNAFTQSIEINSIKECVYVVEFKDCVKIGMSKNVKERLYVLKSAIKKHFLRIFVFECFNNNVIEKIALSEFKNFKIKGEYFSKSFDNVCLLIQTLNHLVQTENEVVCVCENFLEYCKKNVGGKNIKISNFLKEMNISNSLFASIYIFKNKAFSPSVLTNVNKLLKGD
jgi:hypothetical protein